MKGYEINMPLADKERIGNSGYSGPIFVSGLEPIVMVTYPTGKHGCKKEQEWTLMSFGTGPNSL